MSKQRNMSSGNDIKQEEQAWVENEHGKVVAYFSSIWREMT